MKLAEAEWQRRADVLGLFEALDVAGGHTRLVGGAVRDSLLGMPVSDVDLATRFLPDEVIKRLEGASIKAIPTGIAHGTITAVLKSQNIEITTLRHDVQTDGRRATVAFTDDFEADAARRDFTINAMSADPLTGQLFDYFDGLSDLKKRSVRFIGDPLTRIAEDHLRILRFFRFNARFGTVTPDPASMAACVARANDLMALSRERVRDEVLRLLIVEDPAPTVSLMLENKIFEPVLPEVSSDCATRLQALVDAERSNAVAPAAIRRLSAIFPPDQKLADDISRRLRLSNAERARLVSAAGRQEADLTCPPAALAYRLGHEAAIDRLLLLAAPEHAFRELDGWIKPKMPITGGDLVQYGIGKGPLISRLLKQIEEDWIDEGFPDDREVIGRIVSQKLSALGINASNASTS